MELWIILCYNINIQISISHFVDTSKNNKEDDNYYGSKDGKTEFNNFRT